MRQLLVCVNTGRQEGVPQCWTRAHRAPPRHQPDRGSREPRRPTPARVWWHFSDAALPWEIFTYSQAWANQAVPQLWADERARLGHTPLRCRGRLTTVLHAARSPQHVTWQAQLRSWLSALPLAAVEVSLRLGLRAKALELRPQEAVHLRSRGV